MPKKRDIINLAEITPISPKIRRNWLLVIGIDKYKEPKLKLNNCVSDVTTLAELLCKRYHFEASDIIRLLNAEATASNINKVLKEARAHSSEDNLIIFFSGHGSSEELTGEYYWQPWEADHEDETTWYALNHFKASLKALPHQHILVIVDACFPIGMLRGNSNNIVAQLDQEKSRFALISGRDYTVSDGNPGEQSPFAAALIRALTTNDEQWLRVGLLYQSVLEYTAQNTKGLQLPEYRTIPGFEKYDGEFCLQLRSNFINNPSNNLELATPVLPRYFKAIPIAHIQPSDLMPLRSRPTEGFRDFYHERSYLDNQLYENYAIRQHTIITGKPLAGKTRAALQLIKKLHSQDITVLLPKEGFITKEDFQWPKQGNYILFVDEIDRFLENDNGEWLLQKMLSFENVFVLAACWDNKYPEVKNNIAQYLHTFKEQKIGLLNDEDIQIIIMYAPKSILTRSDRTIGSYFLPMHEMKRRYESLTKGSLEQEIFRTCKVYFYWNNINRSTYSKQKIKEYIDIRFQKHYGRAESIFPAQWESAFHQLHELTLLEEQIDELVVEEIYLSDFIIEDQETLIKEYITYFPSHKNTDKAIIISDSSERAVRIFDFVKQNHLPIDVDASYTNLINKATTFEASRLLLEDMKTARIKPNEVTFTILINKASTLEAARILLEEMKTAGIKPDEFTFNSLIKKTSTLETARLLLEDMKTAGIKPDEVTFNSLINKASTLEVARLLLEDMKMAGIKPDEVTFTSLINKASTLEAARLLLEEMKASGIKPNEVTFTSLINKASTLEASRLLLEDMKTAGIKPDEFTFNSLINKASTLETARLLLEDMKTAGIKPDEFTFTILINKASTLEAARILLEEMKMVGIKPNEFTFNSLIKKTSTLETARLLLEDMKTAGIKPDEVTFNSLINKASTLEAARLLLDEMKASGIKPNEVTFTSLINKASTLEAARLLLEEMKTAGIKPDEFTFTSLINKATTFEASRLLFKEMKTAGIKPNEVTFTSLINKASTLEVARLILEEMKTAGIKPNEVTFTILINKAKTFEASRLLLEEMKMTGIEPDTFTFSSFIKKSSSIEHVLFVLEELNVSIPSIDIGIYNFILNNINNINFIRPFLLQMRKSGITPNEYTLEIIFDIVYYDLDSSEDFFSTIIKSGDLFKNEVWLNLFIYECLPNNYQYFIWEDNICEVLSHSDETIALLAWQCHIPEYKILLAESLKDKNWNYYALMGESHVLLDWKIADTYFENALEYGTNEQKYVIWELIAKNIVWNYLTDRYPEAWQYCIDALALQEKGYLNLSLQLLLHMLIEQTEFADLGDSIDNLLLVYPINHQELVCFLEEEFLDTKSVSTEKLKILNEICQREHD